MMKRPTIGDVIEIPTGHGFAYALYCNYYSEPPVFGALLQVFTSLHAIRPAEVNRMCSGDSFYTFFPISPVVRRGLAAIVARRPIPIAERVRPDFRAYNVNAKGEIASRFIVGDNGEKRVDRWTQSELELSIQMIHTFDTLVAAIEAGWHPRQVK